MARREAAMPGLGIDGLPPAAALLEPGGAYAVHAPLAWTLVPLLAGMVARALLDRRPVTLVAGTVADEVIQQLAAHGVDAAAEMSAGRLLVLTQAAHAGVKLANFGAGRFVEELEYFCNPRGRLHIIAPADELYAPEDRLLASQQSRTYARWCSDSRAPAAFIFTASETAVASTLQALDGWFAGVARLAGDGLRLSWDIEHWRSPEGSVGSRQYGIGVAHDGALLVADGAQTSPNLKIVEAPDYDVVLAVAAAVKHEKSRPAHWQLLGSVDAMLTRASGAVAATFILDCGPQQDIEQLAHAVHHLRIHAGNGVKIIIRERGRRLRYNQEMLLGKLGASAVADASLSFSRFQSLVDSLRDRSFDRPVAPVFEEAVLQAVPPEEQGYLPVPPFIVAVRDAVARATLLGVQCSLVRLVINPQLAHLDVLKRIRASRPGDLYAADERSVLLFLFACREPDIDTALARIVGDAQTELFDAQLRSVGADAINVALTAMERQQRLSAAVDYSTALVAPAPAAEVAAAAAQPEPAPALPREYAAVYASAPQPRSATRQPLPVREGT